MTTYGTSTREASSVPVLGRCIVCGGPVLATEPGALVGSITVTRDLFSRFECYNLMGHEGCADALIAVLGLGPASAEDGGEEETVRYHF